MPQQRVDSVSPRFEGIVKNKESLQLHAFQNILAHLNSEDYQDQTQEEFDQDEDI